MNYLLKTLNGERSDPPPLWLMRQAGRYLPEYRDLRKTCPDFISFCLDSNKASTATLQPIDRFDLDAAIIFSDILLVPWAMGNNVRFIENHGPKLEKIENLDDLEALTLSNLSQNLAPIGESIRKTRLKLSSDKALIGFCGAPWTVATYMLEGGGSRDFTLSRSCLWRDSALMTALINYLVVASVSFLEMQARAGADVLMIFDSWAGVVPSFLRKNMIIEPVARIVSELKALGITQPIIGFPKGLSGDFANYVAATGIDALAIDHTVDAEWLDAHLPKDLPVQGNLDPIALKAGGIQMEKSIISIRDAFHRRPHIFNLGHGIDKNTPIEHVKTLVSLVKKPILK